MAIPLVIPNTVQVRLLWSLSGSLGINVLHAIAPGGYTVNQTTANTLGAAVKSAFSANLGATMNGSVAIVRVGLRDLRTANSAEFLDSGAAVGGTGTGDMLPASVASAVTLRTAKAGKSFTGRVYISGFIEAENDANGSTSSAAASAAVGFMVGVQSAMTASGLQLAVASRPSEEKIVVETTNHNDGTTTLRTLSHTTAKPGQSTPVTAVQSRTASWESQRRRTNGRGVAPAGLFPVAEATL